MANTYVAIATTTVGSGGAATISFTSIPQTYTDLVVVLSARGTDAGTGANDGRLTFNGSSSGYSSRLLYGTGSAVGSASNSGTYMYWVGGAVAGGHTANTFSNSSIYIPNYTSSNNKSVSFDGVNENNGTYGSQLMTAGLWSNSAAITSISLSLDYNNFAQYSTATLYGVTNAAYGAKATGGIITSDANYYYHTFLASGTFTPTQSLTADCLVVAGGGGTGQSGGGAGGLLVHTSQALSATGYTVTVGAGGAAGATNGNQGSNSQFGSLTASVGGGYGADGGAGGNGGSGGGGGAQSAAGGTATSGQGNAGGTGGSSGNPNEARGGGGGAGAVGGNGSAGGVGGNGGVGTSTYSSWGVGQLVSGTYYLAGGGGGWGRNGNGTGGYGGGANASSGNNASGLNGTANTGGGAGGVDGSPRGTGGSGVIVIRYAK